MPLETPIAVAESDWKSSDGACPNTRPVTVCQVLHGLSVGGAEILATGLARRLRREFRFVFACLDELGMLGRQLRAEGFPVCVLHRRPGLDTNCIRRLAQFLRNEQVDLIHAHQYAPFFYSLTARLLYRRPAVLFTEHGRWFPDYPRRKRILANRLLLEKRDRVVAVGENVRQAIIDNEGIHPERVSVIYNGIDLAPFLHHSNASNPSLRNGTEAVPYSSIPSSNLVGHALSGVPGLCQDPTLPSNGRLAMRKEMGVAPNDLVIIQVARLDALKDHTTAIGALAHVVRFRSDARLVLVGEGPELASIQQLVRERGLAPNVRFMGLRRDVPRLMHAADLLLLTSKSEGIPLTVIEAMAAGLPVVSTNVGGVGEIIEHGHTGLLAPVGHAEKLATNILDLLGDPERGARMASLGKQRASTVFSETRMHSEYLSLYNEMLSLSSAL